MSFVLDCSVTMTWCFADEASEETDQILEQLKNSRAHIPKSIKILIWKIMIPFCERTYLVHIPRKRINS